MFKRLNLHLWQAVHCTLRAAQCTLRTAPAPANAPKSEHVHFILHIEHWTLHTMCLYCILKMYHFPLQTIKICLSWSQDLHGKIYLDLPIDVDSLLLAIQNSHGNRNMNIHICKNPFEKCLQRGFVLIFCLNSLKGLNKFAPPSILRISSSDCGVLDI